MALSLTYVRDISKTFYCDVSRIDVQVNNDEVNIELFTII